MTRRPAPDAEELPTLIRTAFDALPGPDEERLAAIGERLERQLAMPRRRRRIRWPWLWLLLAGGAVAAAWWAGEMMPGYEEPVAPARPAMEREADATIRKNEERSEVIGDTDRTSPGEQESPVIYRREEY